MAVKFVTSVSNSEITKALKSIGIYDGKARMAASKVLQNATRRIKNGAVRRVAVRSGELKRSIKSNYSDDKLVGIIRAKSPHAHLVEFGHKGGTVKPKKRKAMKIGENTFAANAVLPTVKAKPFIIPAFEAEASQIVRDIRNAIQKGK